MYEKGESPIEEIFSWNFRKFASDDVVVRSQQEFQTPAGMFRVDFVISRLTGARKIGIECDGKDFHSAARDSKRDLAIVSTGALNRIYRISGRDIFAKIHDVLHLLSWQEPWLLSEKGELNVERLSAPHYLRNDEWGEPVSGFPYAMIRKYELDREKVSENFEDTENIASRFPTIICWT